MNDSLAGTDRRKDILITHQKLKIHRLWRIRQNGVHMYVKWVRYVYMYVYIRSWMILSSFFLHFFSSFSLSNKIYWHVWHEKTMHVCICRVQSYYVHTCIQYSPNFPIHIRNFAWINGVSRSCVNSEFIISYTYMYYIGIHEVTICIVTLIVY